MQLALLGLDDQTLAIAREAIAGGRHRIEAVCDLSSEQLATLAADGVNLPEPTPWETLLTDTQAKIDAVVAAAATEQEQRAEQLILLAQAGVPLLVAHPVVDSMLVCYRLEMVREEMQGVLIAYLPSRWHPLVERTAELIRGGIRRGGSAGAGAGSPVGLFDHASFERWAVERDQTATLAHFARDVALIRRTCGDVTRIGALGSADEPTAYANLAVQLAGAAAVPTRWSIGPVDEQPGGRLTLFGQRGRVVLQLPDDAPWQLDIRPTDALQPESLSIPDWNAPAAALKKLEDAIRKRGDVAADHATAAEDWHDAARSVELAETVVRSLARGRTIEVQHEELSEAGTFKSLMTALGCGLLLVAVFVFILLGPLWGPRVLLFVLGLFLVLQLLLAVATRGSKRESGRGDECTPHAPREDSSRGA